ncbi:MAG: ribonuclease E activity regulator RraA [Acidiferrobacterales bacterium]
MKFKTTDLCDTHGERVQIAEPLFADFGGNPAFHGEISTVKCFEDNTLVRAAFETPGNGRILIVDGGGSLRCALVGDQIAALAVDNGWAGAIINGCVRDSADIGEISIGLKALATHPRRSNKRGEGQRDVPVHFADVTFTPGHFVYADEDGVIVSSTPLIQ